MKKGIFTKLLNGAKKHSPEILVATGIVGMITSTILAVKATPKACKKMEDKKADLGVTYLTKKEIIQTTWKEYVPAAAVGATSIACIVGGTSTSLRRNTALATLYTMSEKTFKTYKDEVVKVVGEEKAKEIDKNVAKARIKERPIIVDSDESSFVETTGYGNTLIYDTLSGRFFRSSTNAVERAVNNLNKSLLNDQYVTVNELYNEMGIKTIGAGSLIGWTADKEMSDVFFSSDIDENGQAYVVLEYRNRPVPLYNYYV